jgi:hypothetical protein
MLTVFLLMNIVFQSYIHVTMANSSDEWYTTDSDAVTDSESEDGSTSSAFVPPALSHEPCYIVKTLIEHVEAMIMLLEERLFKQQTREGFAFDRMIPGFWNLPMVLQYGGKKTIDMSLSDKLLDLLDTFYQLDRDLTDGPSGYHFAFQLWWLLEAVMISLGELVEQFTRIDSLVADPARSEELGLSVREYEEVLRATMYADKNPEVDKVLDLCQDWVYENRGVLSNRCRRNATYVLRAVEERMELEEAGEEDVTITFGDFVTALLEIVASGALDSSALLRLLNHHSITSDATLRAPVIYLGSPSAASLRAQSPPRPLQSPVPPPASPSQSPPQGRSAHQG